MADVEAKLPGIQVTTREILNNFGNAVTLVRNFNWSSINWDLVNWNHQREREFVLLDREIVTIFYFHREIPII